MEPSLAVYETQPVSSELDIFWETSTNGLVDELNDEILNGDTTTPVEIKDNGFGPIKYDGFGNNFFYWMDEGLTSGSFITSPIYAFNTLGNLLPSIAGSATTFSLISVFDGNNTNRTSEFLLENSPAFFGTIPNTFNIKTNSTFAVLSNNNVTGSFTFNINVNTAGPSWPSDGQMINRTLTLAPSGGIVLQNLEPQITYITPWSFGVSATPNTKLFTLQGYNGSVVGGGKEFEELTWEMTRYSGGVSIPVPELYFVPLGLNTGLVELWLSNTATSAMDSSNPGIGDYYLTLSDGGGLPGAPQNYFSLTII